MAQQVKNMLNKNHFFMGWWPLLIALDRRFDLFTLLHYLIDLQGRVSMSKNARDDGWFYVTVRRIQDELGIPKRSQSKWLGELRDMGFIELTKMGIPAIRYVRLNTDKIAEAIENGSDISGPVDDLPETHDDTDIPSWDQPSPMRGDQPSPTVEIDRAPQSSPTDPDYTRKREEDRETQLEESLTGPSETAGRVGGAPGFLERAPKESKRVDFTQGRRSKKRRTPPDSDPKDVRAAEQLRDILKRTASSGRLPAVATLAAEIHRIRANHLIPVPVEEIIQWMETAYGRKNVGEIHRVSQIEAQFRRYWRQMGSKVDPSQQPAARNGEKRSAALQRLAERS